MVTLPDGRWRCPFSPGILTDLDHLKQFQIIRRAGHRYPFEVAFTYHQEITRGAGGKFDYFRVEVD